MQHRRRLCGSIAACGPLAVLIVLALGPGAGMAADAGAGVRPPNIVFILIDDMG
jgi:hypothetical protein